MTRSEFTEKLKMRSQVFCQLDENTQNVLVDDALTAYSNRLPQVRVQANNPVESDNLYEIPDEALEIIKVWDSVSRIPIRFFIENGELRLGQPLSSSYQSLLSQPFYDNPFQANLILALGNEVATFDIEYTILQTVEALNPTGLEALRYYVEGLAFAYKAGNPEVFADLTDQEASGASTTIKYSSVAKSYETLAEKRFMKFDELTAQPYGRRG